MIKIAITGAETPNGGELIRLLSMHPDVEITAAAAPSLEGVKISDRHHGLIGETNLSFVSTIDYETNDVVFVCGDTISAAELQQLRTAMPELKLIFFSRPRNVDIESMGITYGLPEINRKLLVRGSTAAFIPESFASMALVALYPFARHLLLNGDIRINVTAPPAIVQQTDLQAVAAEIEEVLKTVQKSYAGHITINAEVGETRRSALMDIKFNCPLNREQIEEIYEIYDDHNFTFTTSAAIGVSEVAGTNKCIISIGSVENETAHLRVAADCRLRGSAGEAVHVMNLMFGLHEKTGLSLKASDFEPIG